MATKTIDHLTVQVGITPYEHEGNSYDALRVSVMYQKGYGFYVSWMPVKLTQFGYQTGCLPSQDPLVGGGRIIVERVQKNNSKRLTEMHAALELAQEGIALYFDKRLWTQMEDFMRYVALYGFTEHYRQQVENLKAAAAVAPVMRQYNDLKKKKPDALLLFRCGDFYEAYEQDANDVVKILGTALSKSRDAGNAYDMVGFPHYALDAYLPKLVRAGKRVAICDQINENTNEKTLEDKAMTTKNNQENENVQNAQVNNASSSESRAESHSSYAESQEGSAKANNVTTEADVAEVNDIVPKVTKRAVAQAMVQAANGGPATTMPLGSHSTLVIAGVGGTKSDVRGKTEEVYGSGLTRTNTEGPKVRKSPLSSAANDKVQDSVPQVRLVVYTTRHGDQAPRIDGFGGEDDPRWKRHYDEKLRLKEAAKEADKKNEKLKARMKGKSKEERAELLKQWVSVGSDPFNATVRTDFATGDKAYFMLMGAKYMDAARQLVDAYNSGDQAAIAAAEQAVMDVKNGIVAECQAAREERMAAREANTDSTDKTDKPTATAMSAQELAMFQLFKKFMSGDKAAMEAVGKMVAKQAA